MYTEKQVQAVAHELRDRFIKLSVKDYEIVITLLSMEKAGKITADNIAQILLYVYFGNKGGVLKALERAKPLVSDALIDAVIAEVKGKD
jgi:hypothetical protein